VKSSIKLFACNENVFPRLALNALVILDFSLSLTPFAVSDNVTMLLTILVASFEFMPGILIGFLAK